MSVAIRSAQLSAGTISRRQIVQGGGILSSIGGAIKSVARVASNVLPGPVGAVARIVAGSGGTRSAPTPQAAAAFGAPPISARLVPQQAPPGMPLPGAGALVQRILPGGATGRGSGCMSGFHPNKTAYFLRDGTFVDVGTRCVKNRRRNALNPRALDRSLGRVASAGNALRSLGFKPPNVKNVARSGKKPSRRRKK